MPGPQHSPATAPPSLPDASLPEDPFGLGRWYTLMRGLRATVGIEIAELEAHGLQAPAAGTAHVYFDSAPRQVGTRSILARTVANQLPALPPGTCVERFVVLPGSGGAHVLVPAEPGAARSLGTALLPAGRRRWRVLAQILAKEPGSTLIDRCGRPEVLVVSSPDPIDHAFAPFGEAHIAMAEGVPGPHAKRVIAAGSPKGARSIFKQAMGSAAAAAVAQETRALRELAGLDLAPSLLDAGGSGPSTWLMQSHVGGTRAPDALDSRHGAFALALGSGRGGGIDYAALPGVRLVRKFLARPGTDAFAEAERASLANLEQALERRFRRRHVPIAYGHGDFTPWNLRASAAGLTAFDWEFAEARLPAGFDLIHHHLQVGVLVKQRGAEALLGQLPGAIDLARGPALEMELDEATGLAVLIAAGRDLASQDLAPAGHEQANWLRTARAHWAYLLGRRLGADPGQRAPRSKAA